MSLLNELAGKVFLVPISVDVRERKKLFENNSNRPPVPYSEFSVAEMIMRAISGLKIGDVIQTLNLSACVIRDIKPDGSIVVRSACWDHTHGNWLSDGNTITIHDVKAILGHRFDAQKAKKHVIIQPAEG